MKNSLKLRVLECSICEGGFEPLTKTQCSFCGVNLHTDCAVIDCCLLCYKNFMMRVALKKQGINVIVEGNDMCRVFKGMAYWTEEEKELDFEVPLIEIEEVDVFSDSDSDDE